MPGRATSRTRAEYDEEHVERVRLVRALVEQGGVAIAGVRAILGRPGRPAALAARPVRRRRLRDARRPRRTTRSTTTPLALVDELGWQVAPTPRPCASLSAAVRAAEAAGRRPVARRCCASTPRRCTPWPTSTSSVAERAGSRAGGPAHRRRRHGDGRPGARRPAAGGPGGRERPAGGRGGSRRDVSGPASRRDGRARHPGADATKARSWWTGPSSRRSPDGIRTRATALRGRRARPLHNGAVTFEPAAFRRRATEKNLTERQEFLRIALGREAGDESWGTRTRT